MEASLSEPNNNRQHMTDHALPAASGSRPPCEDARDACRLAEWRQLWADKIYRSRSYASALKVSMEFDAECASTFSNRSSLLAKSHDPSTCWWCLNPGPRKALGQSGMEFSEAHSNG